MKKTMMLAVLCGAARMGFAQEARTETPAPPRVEIRSEKDWEKVTITSVEEEARGLVSKGHVDATAMQIGPMSLESLDAQATKKLKRKAARLGAHLILITGKMQGLIQPGVYVRHGEAYGYQ
ncbi:hypothetical protein [Hymenobacter daeguensis]